MSTSVLLDQIKSKKNMTLLGSEVHNAMTAGARDGDIYFNPLKSRPFSYLEPEEYLRRCYRISSQEHSGYLLSLFNSSLMTFWLGTREKVTKEDLVAMPIYLPVDEEIGVVEKLAEYVRVTHCPLSPRLETTRIMRVIDTLILEFYFPDHLKQIGLSILSQVSHDVATSGGLDSLDATWSDNEVRDKISLLAIRSPLLLRPILEGKYTDYNI